jgi:fucose permease
MYSRTSNLIIGLVFVIAQAGGAIFPALTGVIATKAGVGVLQPILIGLIVAMGVSWALVPKVIIKQS